MSEDSLAAALTGDRSSFRVIGNPYEGYQQKRRRDALQRQKAARLLSASRARDIALSPEEQDGVPGDHMREAEDPSETGLYSEDADMEATTSSEAGDKAPVKHGKRHMGSKGQKWQQRQKGTGGVRAYGLQYGNELMQPEWLTDVPPDLGTNWLVMPRPEGMRCLLVTSRGRTVSWLRNGAPLHRFHSSLPGGSPATAGGCGAAAATAAGGDYCILDCVFHPPNNTYYIQDLLCWRGYALYDCPAEFRAFWLANKLREEGLAPVPAHASTSPPTSQSMSPAAVPDCRGVINPAAPQPHGVPADEGQRRQHPGWGDESGQHGVGGGTAAAAADGGVGVDDVEMGDGHASGSAGSKPSRSGPSRGAAGPQRRGAERQQPPVSYRIVPLPVHPCTLQGLQAAYGCGQPHPHAPAGPAMGSGALPAGPAPEAAAAAAPAAAVAGGASSAGGPVQVVVGAGDVDFVRDGLYLLHRHGHYTPGPAATPLALLWKDLGCSRYLVDTDSNAVPLEHQLTVLVYRSDRTVATEDDPPVVLGRLPEAFVAAMGDKLRPGRLLRFSIRQGGISFHEGRPAGADLHYEGPANQRRGRADTFSKIMFQRLARTQPITLQALVQAVEAGAAAGPPAAPDGGAWAMEYGLPGGGQGF